MSGWISVLGLVTAVSTAISSQFTTINPRIGAWMMLIGTVASAVGGAVNKRVSLGPVATFLGVITAVAGILAHATDVLRPSIAHVIAVLGTAATASGVSLLGWESKSKNGGSGLMMSLGYVPPNEDKPSIRSPKRITLSSMLHRTHLLTGLVGVGNDGRTVYWPDGTQMMRLPSCLAWRFQRLQHRLFFRNIKSLIAIVCCVSLLFNACSQKTTLDRVGAIVLTTVNAYLIEINQLHLGGNLSVEKYSALKANGDLAKQRAEEFARQLIAIGEIHPGDIPALTQQVARLTAFLRQLLQDAGLDPRSKPVRIISFAIDTLNAAAIVIAAIHPSSVVASNRNTGVLRPNPRPAAVKITIPRPDREVRKALEAARLGTTVKPPGYKYGSGGMAEFRLQTAM